MFDSPENALRIYEEAKVQRQPYESDWRTAAAHCLPQHYGQWLSNEGPGRGLENGREAARRVAFDSTAARSLPKYVSVLERLATPSGQQWHSLRATDTKLRRIRRVREYLEEVTAILVRYRNDPNARFRTASNNVYQSMGVYGPGPIFIGKRDPSRVRGLRKPGIKYIQCPMRDVFVVVDEEGHVVAVFRRVFFNSRQYVAAFGKDNLPDAVKKELANPGATQSLHEVVHVTGYKHDFDYDPDAFGARSLPVAGRYLFVKDKIWVGEEEGFRSMPYKMPRAAAMSGDIYGFSPAVAAIASIGGASAMKKTNLRQGKKAVDPPLLAHDDAMINGSVDIRSAAINYGGIDRNGREMIKPLMMGSNFRVGEVMLQDERSDIEDSFYVTLFQILTETPEMTATEVMERVAEKAALLSPTMGGLQSDFLGPTIEREIELLSELGVLPPMPPELAEAGGEYEVTYTSPMAKAMQAENVTGYLRSVEIDMGLTQATGDMSHLDKYDFDVAGPEVAELMSVPITWMATDAKIKKKRADRAEQQQAQQAVEAAPAAASMMKTAGAAQ